MSRDNFVLASILWLVIAFLVIYPLSILVMESFKIAGADSLGVQNYLGFFQDTYYLKTFANTLMLGALVLLTTTAFGVPLAYILARYRQRGKTVFTALILLPIVLPAYAGVFAFIIFLGKYGTVNLLLMDGGIIEKPINFIYGLHGLVFVQSLHMLPFIVLGLSAGFTTIDPSFEEAAEVEGASGFRRFFTITLPLCTPSYLAGAVIVFLWPFTDWLTPLILGQVDFLPSVAISTSPTTSPTFTANTWASSRWSFPPWCASDFFCWPSGGWSVKNTPDSPREPPRRAGWWSPARC